MAITFSDRLIDSGYYDITPEQERELEMLERGTNDDEYQIYVACAESLGWPVKSYDEWLAS